MSEVEQIYKAYPSKCPIKGSSTGKSKANKEKIKRLLKKDYNYNQLIYIIQRYIKECIINKTWMMNFKTFLNNIPDYKEPEPVDFDSGMCEEEKEFFRQQGLKKNNIA